MKVRVTFTRYYTYDIEGADLDDCLEIAEDALDNDSRYPIAESGYDDVDYDISIGGEAKVDALTVRPFHALP